MERANGRKRGEREKSVIELTFLRSPPDLKANNGAIHYLMFEIRNVS